MKKKDRVTAVLARLDEAYGTGVQRHLHFQNAFQLLIATMLSAQCTDARVNLVTPSLFARFPDAAALARADIRAVEEEIRSTGFYHNKAKNIIAAAREIETRYGGEVPAEMALLTALPGVGRKTANVVRGNIFNEPGVVVDTHVGRISRRLGFTKETDPEKAEYDLMRVLPKEHWIRYNTQIITFGRTVCSARNPKCGACFLSDLCPSRGRNVR